MPVEIKLKKRLSFISYFYYKKLNTQVYLKFLITYNTKTPWYFNILTLLTYTIINSNEIL